MHTRDDDAVNRYLASALASASWNRSSLMCFTNASKFEKLVQKLNGIVAVQQHHYKLLKAHENYEAEFTWY